MTLVPPFAPPDGVGAPPERAGIPVKHTDIPLLLENRIGKGRVLTGFFELSWLMLQIGLEDQKQLFENCISYLSDGDKSFNAVKLPEGIFVYAYRTDSKFRIHLVNGIGNRPLRNTVVCHQLEMEVSADRWQKDKISRIYSALEGTHVSWEEKGGRVWIQLESLRVWDIIIME